MELDEVWWAVCDEDEFKQHGHNLDDKRNFKIPHDYRYRKPRLEDGTSLEILLQDYICTQYQRDWWWEDRDNYKVFAIFAKEDDTKPILEARVERQYEPYFYVSTID